MSSDPEKTERPRRSYRGATPAERSETRRIRLIEAAVQVYGELGYRNATVKSVCAAAGLTDRYFYEAFENSEALLAASFEAVTQAVLAEVVATADADGNEGFRRLRVMLRSYFTALRREAARARVFLVEMVGISDTIDKVFDNALRRIGDLIVETLDAEREGPLATSPLLARGVASGLVGIAIAWVRSGYAAPLDDVVGAATKLCCLAAPDGDAGQSRRQE